MKTEKKVERAIDRFFDSAYQGIEHVGTLNCNEREAEAKGWIRKAREDVRTELLALIGDGEPVGEMGKDVDGYPCMRWRNGVWPPDGAKLYLHPPSREPGERELGVPDKYGFMPEMGSTLIGVEMHYKSIKGVTPEAMEAIQGVKEVVLRYLRAEPQQPILHERDSDGNWICCCGDHLEEREHNDEALEFVRECARGAYSDSDPESLLDAIEHRAKAILQESDDDK